MAPLRRDHHPSGQLGKTHGRRPRAPRLQWHIDRPAPGVGDAVSPHFDHLTAGLYRLGRNCSPPHAQKLGHHLRRIFVGNQRRLGDATRSSARQKLKDAATVVIERDRVQSPLRVILLLFTISAIDRSDARVAVVAGTTMPGSCGRVPGAFFKLVGNIHAS
jgi:hypothetical protein